MKELQDDTESQNPMPAFDAIIPATVRYDKRLPPGAKLLYGEIRALSRKLGYGWASNAYLAQFAETCERTIIRWMNALADCGHIIIRYEYDQKAMKTRRHFYLAEALALPKQSDKIVTPDNPEGDKNVTSGVTNLSPDADKNVTLYSIAIDKVTAAAPPHAENSCPQPEAAAPETPPVAAEAFTPMSMKKAFVKINRMLIFDDKTLQSAAQYMQDQGLDEAYLAWLYQQCLQQKNIQSLVGYYRHMFFQERMCATFRESRLPDTPPPEVLVSCPVCGVSHSSRDTACPSCDLPQGAARDEIIWRQKFWSLPPNRREDYLHRKEALWADSSSNLARYHKLVLELMQEFGISR
jgi:rubrerythrin